MLHSELVLGEGCSVSDRTAGGFTISSSPNSLDNLLLIYTLCFSMFSVLL